MALSGKVAVVSGSSQGLGKGFCDILLKNGAKVAMLDINETNGKRTKADFAKEHGEDRVIFLTCDVTSDEQLEDAFQKTKERFGRIDIVSNNAGIVDETNWEKMVEINLKGVIRGTYHALQHMKKESGGEGGVIVNTASLADTVCLLFGAFWGTILTVYQTDKISSHLCQTCILAQGVGLGPLLLIPVYTATKHGVVGFTRAMADVSKASGYGVRINALCPTFVKTPLLGFLTNERTAGQFAHLLSLSKQCTDQAGVVEVPAVAKGFLQLVTDEDNNGKAMTVTENGAAYVNFSEFLAFLPNVSSTTESQSKYLPSQ